MIRFVPTLLLALASCAVPLVWPLAAVALLVALDRSIGSIYP